MGLTIWPIHRCQEAKELDEGLGGLIPPRESGKVGDQGLHSQGSLDKWPSRVVEEELEGSHSLCPCHPLLGPGAMERREGGCQQAQWQRHLLPKPALGPLVEFPVPLGGEVGADQKALNPSPHCLSAPGEPDQKDEHLEGKNRGEAAPGAA